MYKYEKTDRMKKLLRDFYQIIDPEGTDNP